MPRVANLKRQCSDRIPAHCALRLHLQVALYPAVQDYFVLPVRSPRMRPPSFSPGSICHLPPARGGPASNSRRRLWNRPFESDSTFNMLLPVILVNSPREGFGQEPTRNVSGPIFTKVAAHGRTRGASNEDLFGAKRIRLPILLRRAARCGLCLQHFVGSEALESGGSDAGRRSDRGLGAGAWTAAFVDGAVCGREDGAVRSVRRADAGGDGRRSSRERGRGDHRRAGTIGGFRARARCGFSSVGAIGLRLQRLVHSVLHHHAEFPGAFLRAHELILEFHADPEFHSMPGAVPDVADADQGVFRDLH